MQLQAKLPEFEAAGLNVVAITYDAPALQQAFVDKHRVTFTMLADQGGATAMALGILNEEYAPGDSAYGIPYPGVFVVAPGGEIKAKVFLEAYGDRVDADGVLKVAKQALGL